MNYVQFKWLRGDNKDNLHQIIQCLKNQAAQLSIIHAWTDGKKQEDTNQLLKLYNFYSCVCSLFIVEL